MYTTRPAGAISYAGISKIFFPNTQLWPMFVLRFSISTNLATFAEQVESYKLLSPAGVAFVAHTLPFDDPKKLRWMYGVAAHDVYHAGQIQLIKRLMR